jgi:hypothetical protein
MKCDEWIYGAAKGRTFADVGGLWGTVNEKVTVAAKAGAASVTMIDMQPFGNELWKQFFDRCASAGVKCDNSIEANVDDPEFPQAVGRYDIVHCSGVIYHCPNPLHTVSKLAQISRHILILGSTVIQPRTRNTKGEIIIEPGSGLFVPALSSSQKGVIAHFFSEVGAIGVGASMENSWSLDDYSPWWWLLTSDLIAGLLKVCGFRIKETCSEWGGRAAYFLAVRD